MTIVTTPSLLKKSLFFLYLLNAPWLCLFLSALIASFVISQFGAQIPDVASIHSFLEKSVMTQVAAKAEDKDPDAIKLLKSHETIEKEKSDEAQSVARLEKQDTEIKGNRLIPGNLKNIAFVCRALMEYIPWPVYLFGIALLLSFFNFVWFLFHPFMKGFWWGLACIFVPFAPTVFEFKYWKEVKRQFEIGLLCNCLFGICGGVFFGALSFVPQKDASICFADQISQFKMPGATDMNIAAPDIVSSDMSASFFEGPLAAMANSTQGRAALKNMVKKKGNVYEISFPENEKLTADEKALNVSNNRDIPAKALESAFLNHFDVRQIRAQLSQTGKPAIAICLRTLTGKETRFIKASSLSEDETAALVLDLLGRGLPVVVSSKGAKEIGSPETLASSCYAVISADVDTKQALLYNCRRSDMWFNERVPGVEDLGNGLVKVPFSLFPTYIRYIAYFDKW